MAIHVSFRGMETASTDLNSINEKFVEEVGLLEKKITETTLNDWKGSDANAFVESTSAKVEKIKTEYNDYLNDVRSEIIRNNNKFQDVQTQNMNMID